ncbi:MAG: hypothetical protein Tsb0020_18810 [Haliangiales bacterium]
MNIDRHHGRDHSRDDWREPGLNGERATPADASPFASAAGPQRGRLARLAPRLASRLAQARRDAHMVFESLRGRNPSPTIERRVRRHDHLRPRPTERSARILRVTEVERETPAAISVVLEDPTGAAIEFLPGQFFTLLVDVDGRTYRRAYSAASSYRDTSGVRLGIKRVEGGRVSNHLNDHLRVGQLLRVLGPSGSFTCVPRAHASDAADTTSSSDSAASLPGRHLVLIGGGSGITPLLAIAEAILADEPESRTTLIYGNRSEADIIFAQRIDALADAHRARFTVCHVLERPPEGWRGHTGLLSQAVINRVLAELAPTGPAAPDPGTSATDSTTSAASTTTSASARPTHYYLCGPEPMLNAARAALGEHGVPDAAIFEERFTQPHLRAAPSPARVGVVQPVEIQAGPTTHQISVGPDETILDAALAAGVPMRFSCTLGGCGACKVALTQGQVDLEEPNCLSAAERDAGYILTCVARAAGPATLSLTAPPRDPNARDTPPLEGSPATASEVLR